MGPDQLPTELSLPLDAINPISQGAGTVLTAWVSAQNFHSFEATIVTGVLGASATVDAKLQQATSSGGAGAKDIAGKAITQIVKASGDNKMAIINARCSDLDQLNGFAFIALSITVGVAASQIAGLLRGVFGRFEPIRDLGSNPSINFGSANVVQIVS